MNEPGVTVIHGDGVSLVVEPPPADWCPQRPQPALAPLVRAGLVVEPAPGPWRVEDGRIRGGLEPPVATRPQDWAQPARSILFGPDVAAEPAPHMSLQAHVSTAIVMARMAGRL